MQLTLAALFASAAATLVSTAPQPRQESQDCPESDQFGYLYITWAAPGVITPGNTSTLTISANFSCAINAFGHIPAYTDYYIEVLQNNNDNEPPILLARRTLAPGNTTDEFTVPVPDANYNANASYAVNLDTTYSVNGTNGIPYYVVGSVNAPILVSL